MPDPCHDDPPPPSADVRGDYEDDESQQGEEHRARDKGPPHAEGDRVSGIQAELEEVPRKARHRVSGAQARHIRQRMLLASLPHLRHAAPEVPCRVLGGEVQEERGEGRQESEGPRGVRMDGRCHMGMQAEERATGCQRRAGGGPGQAVRQNRRFGRLRNGRRRRLPAGRRRRGRRRRGPTSRCVAFFPADFT